MKVNHFEEVDQQAVHNEDARGCRVRWLLGEEDGAPNFSMRQFEVAPGGFTPRHSHPYEHEVYVIDGEGIVLEGTREHCLRPGVVVLVRPDEVHQFRNTGAGPLRFLCLIPNSAARQGAMAQTQAQAHAQEHVKPECGMQ